MKKIILALLFLSGTLFSQVEIKSPDISLTKVNGDLVVLAGTVDFKFSNIGTWWIPKFRPFGTTTTFTDSTNYVTLNKGFYAFDSIKAGAWIFAGANKQGGLYLDTNKKGEISFTGQSMYLYNRKENGYIYFYSGEKGSGFSFNKFSGGATSEIASIDTINGFSLYAGNIQINQAENPTGQIKIPSDTASDYAGSDNITLNRQSGTLTTKSLTTAAGSLYALTLTNSLITANSKVFASINDGTSSQGLSILYQCRPGSGSGTIVIYNGHATQAFNGTFKIYFVIFN